jgi:hypothetical protein
MASDYRNNFHLCMDCLQALVLKPYLSPDARALALESKAAGKPPRSCSIRPRLLSAADRLTVGYLAAPGAPQSVRRNEEFSVHRTKVRQQPPCPPRITQCSVQETELLKPISARIGHDQGR